MEKNNSKIVAVVALVVAVVALSVGFATFSATLTITNTSAAINPTNTFTTNVKYAANSVSCTTTGDAVVSNSGTLTDTAWNGVAITLKTPGDKATCTANISNLSSFVAYLREINTATALSCSALAGSNAASAANVTAVCNALSLVVTVGTDSATATASAAGSAVVSGTTNKIATSGTQAVKFELTYASGSQPADGDITVNVPQMNVIYKTA